MDIFSTTARDRLYDVGLLLLRIVAGGFLLTHGLPKLTTLMGSEPIQFADPFGVGQELSLGLTVFAEVVCAFLVIIGLLTRLAVIPIIIVMCVAFFYVHAADPFGVKEMSGLYLTIYVFLAITGAGRYSIDNLISKRRNTKTNYYTTTNM
jgi:putative oxidoreductase